METLELITEQKIVINRIENLILLKIKHKHNTPNEQMSDNELNDVLNCMANKTAIYEHIFEDMGCPTILTMMSYNKASILRDLDNYDSDTCIEMVDYLARLCDKIKP